MNVVPYAGLAARCKGILGDDRLRRRFLETLPSKHIVRSVLGFSCGTGSDLIMFSSFVDSVTGSDTSDSMLRAARGKIDEAGLDLALLQADFGNLHAAGLHGFDAVLCLSSSIDEIHSDRDLIRSLKSMCDAFNDNGVLVVAQGQNDAMMQAALRFIPIVNDPAFSRLFVLDYHYRQRGNSTVTICDLEHAPQRSSITAPHWT